MPTVSLVSAASLDKDAAVVIGVHPGPEPAAGSAPVDDALGGRLLAALGALGATGKPDEVLLHDARTGSLPRCRGDRARSERRRPRFGAGAAGYRGRAALAA